MGEDLSRHNEAHALNQLLKEDPYAKRLERDLKALVDAYVKQFPAQFSEGQKQAFANNVYDFGVSTKTVGGMNLGFARVGGEEKLAINVSGETPEYLNRALQYSCNLSLQNMESKTEKQYGGTTNYFFPNKGQIEVINNAADRARTAQEVQVIPKKSQQPAVPQANNAKDDTRTAQLQTYLEAYAQRAVDGRMKFSNDSAGTSEKKKVINQGIAEITKAFVTKDGRICGTSFLSGGPFKDLEDCTVTREKATGTIITPHNPEQFFAKMGDKTREFGQEKARMNALDEPQNVSRPLKPKIKIQLL